MTEDSIVRELFPEIFRISTILVTYLYSEKFVEFYIIVDLIRWQM